ncbi:MAG: tRNA uridine-5-carboxymethylaminomethyl(34) synthesis GTPase MnmE [Clostridia bacterium]|nr:tRNA uridine-5-carboxymethylaminomethyl(34) synthesis GTPase MnmE [Clostridia bacterium]
MMNETDTICARSTPPGEGGIAIVRVSGPEARSILDRASGREDLTAGRLTYCHIRGADGEDIDEVMAVYLPPPKTYTREAMAEIQCHGSDSVAGRILRRCIELGARPAEPGEFTRRAFLNGRIDITQAEAVMEIIGAGSEEAARASLRQLEGGVSAFVRRMQEGITSLLAVIGANIDFPEEMDEEVSREELYRGIRELLAEIGRKTDERAARLLREGASIVLAGRPNVGKSSLMNALLNYERAIVTEIPGTTRDVLTERIQIGGIWAEISDTAGLRDTKDPVERIGVERAREAADRADLLLVVIDAGEAVTEEIAEQMRSDDPRIMICLNKTDVPGLRKEQLRQITDKPVWEISARTGEGLRELTEEMERRIARHVDADALTVERHMHLAKKAEAALKEAAGALENRMPVDILSVHLEQALMYLGQITSVDGREQVIDEIFSRFCVGK